MEGLSAHIQRIQVTSGVIWEEKEEGVEGTNPSLELAKAGGEQRGSSRGCRRVGGGRGGGGGCWGSGGGELTDEGSKGLRVGAAVAERHEQREGVAVEAGVQDLGHLERQLQRLLRLPRGTPRSCLLHSHLARAQLCSPVAEPRNFKEGGLPVCCVQSRGGGRDGCVAGGCRMAA